MDRNSNSKRGAVLLLSLCILFLLSLFALTFVRLVNFERRASTNYVDSVRARMLARAGISRAVSELQAIASRRHYSDVKADKWEYDLQLPTTMNESQRFQLQINLDLLTTTNPSFVINDPDVFRSSPTDPAPVMFQAPLAVSGVLGRTYDNGLDVYKLKVIEASSQLNLNHPHVPTIERMLTNLLRACADEDPTIPAWNLPESVARGIATYVIGLRPMGGFKSKSELKALLQVTSGIAGLNASNTITDERWNLLVRDKLTVISWEDNRVIRPWNLGEVPERGLPPMPRSPININTAPKPVLVALLAGLEARNDYGTFKLGYTNAKQIADRIIAWRTVGSGASPYAGRVPASETEVAAGVTLRKGPFRSWNDFENFVDHRLFIAGYSTLSMPTRPASPRDFIRVPGSVAADANWQGVKRVDRWPEGLVPRSTYAGVSPVWKALQWGQGIRDMIKAQLNPNTMLNKFGASHGGRRHNGMVFPRLVDKSDLVNMTTEGCFASMGVYEITSVGMVLFRDAEAARFYSDFLGVPLQQGEMTVVASQTQQVIVRLYDVVRYTSQADFEKYRASMLPGDFIPDTQAWRGVLGVNRANPLIMSTATLDDVMDGAGDPAGVPSWPGVVSQPNYSLVRFGDAMREVAPDYVPATYDGHLTLTNLLGVTAKADDFIAGFARGTMGAFKCRVWWDPKDQDPYGCDGQLGAGYPFLRNALAPSHPEGSMPPAGTIPPGADAAWWDGWFDGTNSAGGKTVSLVELSRLCEPLAGPKPRMKGIQSNEHGVLDHVDNTPPADGQWLHEGASLWNGGIAVSPRRTDTGDPACLVYDGDNIDLDRASSIRFWVQPQVDPFLRPTEVLLSFIGSRDGMAREVGFKIYKEATSDGAVTIYLHASPSFDSGLRLNAGRTLNPSTNARGAPASHPFVAGSGAHDYHQWHVQDSSGGTWTSRIGVIVSPKLGQRTGATPTFPTVATTTNWGAAPSGSYETMTPIEPEWLANTWHWVVLNYGYARPDGGPGGFAQFDASLQVDLSPPQPPWALDPNNPGRIALGGDTTLPSAASFFGEFHAHEHTDWANRPPGGANTGPNPREMIPLGSSRAECHCARYGGGALPCGFPGHPSACLGLTSYHIDFHGQKAFTHGWLEPRTLGDFYNCRSGGSTVISDQTRVIPNAVTYDPGPPAVFTATAPITWAADTFDHYARYLVNHSGAGSPLSVPLTYTGGQWTVTVPSQTVLDGLGTISSIDLELTEKRAQPQNDSEHCVAQEISPGVWDGEAMHQWTTNPGIFPLWTQVGDVTRNPITAPNGDATCVNRMAIHGRIGLDCGVAPFPLPCWITTRTEIGCWFVTRGTAAIAPPSRSIHERPYEPGEWPSRVPIDLICDGCRGCENCDVDAPLFIGGEPPPGAENYQIVAGEKVVVSPDPTTMAYAVFDNLVIKNRREFSVRTDFAAEDSPLVSSVDWYEDRYYDTAQARGHYELLSTGDPDTAGYGAVYRRGLLELFGQRTRLGSMNWTTYPTSDDRMQFEIKLYNIPSQDGGAQTWRDNNAGLLTTPGTRLLKRSGEFPAGGGTVTSFKTGLAFGDLGDDSVYDGVGAGAAKPPDILVLAVQLGKLYAIDASGEDTGNSTEKEVVDHTGGGNVTFTGTGLPTPIMETPVLEDITLNLVRETPMILYSEEGIACN